MSQTVIHEYIFSVQQHWVSAKSRLYIGYTFLGFPIRIPSILDNGSIIQKYLLPVIKNINNLYADGVSRGHMRIGPWASYQIRKIAGCACAGNAGNVFPATAGKRSRHALRHVRDARAVMHTGIANWRFPLNSAAGENVPGIPGVCAPRNFTYLVRGPWHDGIYRFHL